MHHEAHEFEAERPRLQAIAFRMLGDHAHAEDVVQESWVRLQRVDAEELDSLPAWLTRTVSRLCLDHLRRRDNRREQLSPERSEWDGLTAPDPDPEAEALLADQIGAAMVIVLSSLSPAERVAFVLHDFFAVPFDEVGAAMGRSVTAVRQLASRARRNVRGVDPGADVDRATQYRAVDAFLAASRSGDLAGLLTLLDPDAMVRADPAAVAMGSATLTEGADAVATTFSGRALGAELVDIDGYAGAAWFVPGGLKVAFAFTMADDGRIAEIEILADPDSLSGLDLTPRSN